MTVFIWFFIAILLIANWKEICRLETVLFFHWFSSAAMQNTRYMHQMKGDFIVWKCIVFTLVFLSKETNWHSPHYMNNLSITISFCKITGSWFMFLIYSDTANVSSIQLHWWRHCALLVRLSQIICRRVQQDTFVYLTSTTNLMERSSYIKASASSYAIINISKYKK